MNTVKDLNFYCGTSNIVLPVPNKTFLPDEFQDKSRLHYYSTIFNSLEINSSFYKIPMPRTVLKWADEVPDNFKFSFKLFKGITHQKDLVYDTADIDRFLFSVHSAGAKKGCLLVQFPGSIKYSLLIKMKALLGLLANNDLAEGWRIAIEFRDQSWYRDEVYELLEKNNMALVQHDMPKSITPFDALPSTFIYLRFHGELGDYRGSYSKEFLDEYHSYIQRRITEGKSVFAYFNNTMGDAVHNAITLKNNFLIK